MLNIRSKVWRQSLTLVFIGSHSVLSFRSVDYSDTKKRKHPSVTDDNTVVMKKTCKLGITAPETPSFVRYALSLFDYVLVYCCSYLIISDWLKVICVFENPFITGLAMNSNMALNGKVFIQTTIT